MRRTLSLLAVATLSCTAELGVEHQEVRNGASGAAQVDRVFYLTSSISVEPKVGSSANVKYKRCLLTAAHVVENELLQTKLVYRGQDLRDLDGKEYQNIQRGALIPNHALVSRDLAVLWATNFATPPDRSEIRIPLSGWSPTPIIDTIGLANVQYTDGGPMSTGAPLDVMIGGYGFNDTVAGVDVGSDVLRVGSMAATHYVDTTVQMAFQPTTGGFYRLAAAPDQSICSGDSGGPAGIGAGIFGVISMYTGPNCAGSVDGLVTALNHAALPNEVSNWDWVNQQIELLCRKSATVGVEGEGHIEGSITPPQSYHHGLELNDAIAFNPATGANDSVEYVHEGQTVTFTATPASGWRFKQWSSWATRNCPCDGSTSPTCTAPYAAIGRYNTYESIDDAACRADFELIPGADGGMYGGGSGAPI